MGLFALVESGLRQVDKILTETLTEDNELVKDVSDYLLMASGKRLRPALVLLAGQFGEVTELVRGRLISVAAAVEMIHMATLIHDDIIDKATVRRGIPAVRQQFNDPVAVLSGDFLFASAFQLFSQSTTDIVRTAARVVHVMCVGEIEQHLDRGQMASQEAYWKKIEAKTGFFLETSCKLGGLASQVSSEALDALGRYGHHIGLAYQVVDDLLDWLADPEKLGKAVGIDLAAGIYTLPLIYALDHPEFGQQLQHSLALPNLSERITAVREVLEASGALAYTRQQAEYHIRQAVNVAGLLPDGPAREALVELAEFILSRDH